MLIDCEIENEDDPHLDTFLNACESNDITLVQQLAPNRDVGLLSFGLRRALECGHHDLARQLLERDAKWDATAVDCASKSLDTLQMLSESGFDVNTSLGWGSVLLK